MYISISMDIKVNSIENKVALSRVMQQTLFLKIARSNYFT